MTDSKEYHLPDYVRFVRLDDDRAVLSAPIQKHVVEGDAVGLVAKAVPLLREGTTPATLADGLSVSHSTAEQLLTRLQNTDLVRPRADVDSDLVRWASSQPNDTQTALADTTIAVLSEASITTAPPESFDASCNVRHIDAVSSLSDDQVLPELLLTVAAGASPEFHRAVLDSTWSAGIPWLPIRLVDTEIRLGPYAPPGTDACYNCYYQRLVASAPDMELIEREHRQCEQRSRQLYPAVIDAFIWSLAHMEALSIVAPDRTPEAAGSVVAVDPLEMETTSTDVLKLPGYEVCGTN